MFGSRTCDRIRPLKLLAVKMSGLRISVTSRSRRKVPLGISRPWRVVGIIRFEQRGFSTSRHRPRLPVFLPQSCFSTSTSYQHPCFVYSSLITDLITQHVFYIDRRIDRSGSKKVLGLAVEDPGQVRETLLLLLAVDTYSRCIIFIQLEFVCFYRNELSWWCVVIENPERKRVFYLSW